MPVMGGGIAADPRRQQHGILSSGSAPAFSPLDISGLSLWLKAESLALNDGDPVAAWTDSSGNGNDASQSTAGNKPLYKANIFGSKPAILFDAVDDYLTVADDDGLDLSSGSYCIFAVVKRGTTGDWSWILEKGDGNNAHIDYLLGKNGDGTNAYRFIDRALSEDIAGTALATSTKYILTAQRSVSGGFFRTFLNGVQDATSALSGSSGENAHPLYIGCRGDLSQAWDGHIAAVLIYKADLNASQRGQVETFLNQEYQAF